MNDVSAAREETLREWAKLLDVPLNTVRGWLVSPPRSSRLALGSGIMNDVSHASEVTLSEWADLIGRPRNTVRGWERNYPAGTVDPFPVHVRVAGVTRLWRLSVLDAWLKRHPTLGHPRGEHRGKS